MYVFNSRLSFGDKNFRRVLFIILIYCHVWARKRNTVSWSVRNVGKFSESYECTHWKNGKKVYSFLKYMYGIWFIGIRGHWIQSWRWLQNLKSFRGIPNVKFGSSIRILIPRSTTLLEIQGDLVLYNKFRILNIASDGKISAFWNRVSVTRF